MHELDQENQCHRGNQGDDGEERKGSLLNGCASLIRRGNEEEQCCGEHRSGPKEHEGEANGRGREHVDEDPYEYLKREKEVVKALVEGHFFRVFSRFFTHVEGCAGALGGPGD